MEKIQENDYAKEKQEEISNLSMNCFDNYEHEKLYGPDVNSNQNSSKRSTSDNLLKMLRPKKFNYNSPSKSKSNSVTRITVSFNTSNISNI